MIFFGGHICKKNITTSINTKTKKMKKIRQSVFETNSSSTHSICVANTTVYKVPKKLHLDFGQFGWESDTLRTVGEKASYLYTGLVHERSAEETKAVITFLEELGIDVTYDPAVYDEKGYLVGDGYIDHSSELGPFLDVMVSDKKALAAYLFSDLSYIRTGNDNDESDISINVEYPHIVFYKGN